MITKFSDFRCVDPFQRYLRSKSKVLQKSRRIIHVFLLSQTVLGTPSKSCTHVITAAS